VGLSQHLEGSIVFQAVCLHASVRVIGLGHKSVGLNVTQSGEHGTTLAAQISVKEGGTVHQLLDGNRSAGLVVDVLVSFNDA